MRGSARLNFTRHSINAALLWLPVFGWCQDSISTFDPAPTAVLLNVGTAATQAQRANQRVQYRFDAAAGRDYLLELEQHGLDFVLELHSPSGETLLYDSPLLRDEREFIFIRRATAGAYALTVFSDEHTGASGAYALRLSAFDEAADIEPWRLMSRGAQRAQQGEQRNAQDALAAFRQAAEIWRSLDRGRERAQALYSMARIHYELSDWAQCAELAQLAANLYMQTEHTALAANAQHLLAAALIEQAANIEHAPEVPIAPQAQAIFNRALHLFNESIAVHERLGNAYEIGVITNDLGLAHFYMGATDLAKTEWQNAAAMLRALHEWTAELKPLANQAVIDAEQGYLISAIESFQRVMQILPAGKLQDMRAGTLDNLAASQRLFGNYDDALRSYNDALRLHSELGDVGGSAYSLTGIGQVYYGLGEFELAKDYLQRALPMLQQANDGAGQMAAFNYLGRIAYWEEDLQRAIAYHTDALSYTSSALDRAYVQHLLARDHTALGQYSEALRHAEQAQATARTLNEPRLFADATLAAARALIGMSGDSGVADPGAADSGAAQRRLESALAIYESLNLQAEQGDVFNALALEARARGDLAAAIRFGASSIERIEQLRDRVADPELRAFQSSLRREFYDLQIDLLMSLHERNSQEGDRYQREAFAVAERSRARMHADLLAEASADLRQGMDPALVERRENLYANLAQARYRRDRLMQQTVAEDPDDALAASVEDLAVLENELNLIETQMRRENPRYANLSAPQILSAEDIQQRLDTDTVLLQYVLAAGRSFVWVLTDDSMRVAQLKGRDEIEAAARLAYERLQQYRAEPGANRDNDAALTALAALVLEPIAQSMQRPRVLVVADGALQYIPFGVLPDAAGQPVLEQRQVVSLPSMSSLAQQLQRSEGERPGKRLAVFADPVLQLSDPRFTDIAQTSLAANIESGAMDAVARPALLASDLARLPATGYEARTVAALLPADQRDVSTGFAASRDAVLSVDLSQYRVLHFATHGQVDSRYPALSSLVFSQFDRAGVPRDGHLRLHDIYNLKLNADLVVLSACETALGRSVRGEGLIGLAQGFMYAGARGLVASLWQVPDRATAELMTHFYRHLFVDGLSPGAALRQAQLAIAASRRWRDPYFWGAFVLVGDGR